jgi:hypothetical protein
MRLEAAHDKNLRNAKCSFFRAFFTSARTAFRGADTTVEVSSVSREVNACTAPASAWPPNANASSKNQVKPGPQQFNMLTTRNTLVVLFSAILVSLLGFTSWASTQQPVWEWQGLVSEPDRWWTIATLMDAYYGFLTFFVWVCFKEHGALRRIGWFVAIMVLGNMAMATYVLLQIARLKPNQPVSAILLPTPQTVRS